MGTYQHNRTLRDNSKKRKVLKVPGGERKTQVEPGNWRKKSNQQGSISSSRVVSPEDRAEMRAVRRVLASHAPLSHLNADNLHYVKLAIERPFPDRA
jgi:hypothetical protein